MAQSQSDHDFSAPVEINNKPQMRAGQGGADLKAQLQRELGAAAVQEDANPLLNIGRSMTEVSRRMLQADAGPAILAMEKQIVADLDRLIEQARKSAGQNSSSASGPKKMSANDANRPSGSPPDTGGEQKSGNQPAASTSPTAPIDSRSRKSDMKETRDLMKNLWGELPPQVRQQMLQTPMEEFVPKYQEQIEDYFRELSKLHFLKK